MGESLHLHAPFLLPIYYKTIVSFVDKQLPMTLFGFWCFFIFLFFETTSHFLALAVLESTIQNR